MALCKRIVGRLDIKGSRLIKGVRFEGLRVVGDPSTAAVEYVRSGADELLYIDTVASLYGRNSLTELLKQAAREVFVPITAGGGVRSIADAAELLAAGADKIAVNTAGLSRPELYRELVQAFGSQCVVASIQARRTNDGRWEAMVECGRERTGKDVCLWFQEVQNLGVGEILLTSVDQDGTCSGPDYDLLDSISSITKVPLIFAGGFAQAPDVFSCLQRDAVSAVAIGAALHRKITTISELKSYSVDQTAPLPIRVTESSGYGNLDHSSLQNLTIGIIDYGMGNQQSLCNALSCLGASVVLSDESATLSACDVIALPGVGAFPTGMANLTERGLDHFIRSYASSGRPIFGICLGMQMLFQSSDEFAFTPGLAILQGHVTSLSSSDIHGNPLVLPHVGWNRLLGADGLQDLPDFPIPGNQYFVHTYAAAGVPESDVIYRCRYGHIPFVAAVRHGSVFGFQFHPERSGRAGLYLLQQTCLQLTS